MFADVRTYACTLVGIGILQPFCSLPSITVTTFRANHEILHGQPNELVEWLQAGIIWS